LDREASIYRGRGKNAENRKFRGGEGEIEGQGERQIMIGSDRERARKKSRSGGAGDHGRYIYNGFST